MVTPSSKLYSDFPSHLEWKQTPRDGLNALSHPSLPFLRSASYLTHLARLLFLETHWTFLEQASGLLCVLSAAGIPFLSPTPQFSYGSLPGFVHFFAQMFLPPPSSSTSVSTLLHMSSISIILGRFTFFIALSFPVLRERFYEPCSFLHHISAYSLWQDLRNERVNEVLHHL